MSVDRDRRRFTSGPCQVILIKNTKVGQVDLHRLWGHEREEGIDAVLREVVGEGTEEQAAKGASEAEGVGVPLAVGEAPGSEVMRGEVVGEEPVTTREGNGVAQDGTTDGVTCMES